ncbi:MAG: hypothetical protein QOF55_648 [Thermoleophilaceae bacterium]|nr:hypothetical protein [Thermoleophilaceae bacterium]
MTVAGPQGSGGDSPGAGPAADDRPLRVAPPSAPPAPGPAAPAPGPAPALPPGVAEMTRWLCALETPAGGISGDFVTGHYHGIPGNQPKLYANHLAIWEGTVVPWTAPAIGQVAIDTNNTAGSAVIRELSIGDDSYTVGYGVGEAASDICAAVTFDADQNTVAARAVELSINLVEPNSIAVHYRTLAGYRPAKAANWIGLWRGEASPYDAPDPVARHDITEDVNENDVSLDGLTLVPGANYTLVHFMSALPTSAAALITFRVAGR